MALGSLPRIPSHTHGTHLKVLFTCQMRLHVHSFFSKSVFSFLFLLMAVGKHQKGSKPPICVLNKQADETNTVSNSVWSFVILTYWLFCVPIKLNRCFHWHISFCCQATQPAVNSNLREGHKWWSFLFHKDSQPFKKYFSWLHFETFQAQIDS